MTIYPASLTAATCFLAGTVLAAAFLVGGEVLGFVLHWRAQR